MMKMRRSSALAPLGGLFEFLEISGIWNVSPQWFAWLFSKCRWKQHIIIHSYINDINGKMLSRTSLLPFVWKPRNHGTFAIFGHPPASPCAQKRKPALAIARTKARWGKSWFRPARYHLFFSWHHWTSQGIQQRLVQIWLHWLNKFSFWLREDIPIPTARARPVTGKPQRVFACRWPAERWPFASHLSSFLVQPQTFRMKRWSSDYTLIVKKHCQYFKLT